MFPGSKITKQFPMGKTKEIYLISQRLDPYFKDRLLNVLNAARFIVTSFDESFNIVISKGQIDVLVRFWNTAESRVSARYINSVSIRKATAPDFLENVETVSEGLNTNKFIQLSSDGPNVKLTMKFLELIAEKCKNDGLNELISIGTCSLHTVNIAF